jgi:hypothetical protein
MEATAIAAGGLKRDMAACGNWGESGMIFDKTWKPGDFERVD